MTSCNSCDTSGFRTLCNYDDCHNCCNSSESNKLRNINYNKSNENDNYDNYDNYDNSDGENDNSDGISSSDLFIVGMLLLIVVGAKAVQDNKR